MRYWCAVDTHFGRSRFVVACTAYRTFGSGPCCGLSRPILRPLTLQPPRADLSAPIEESLLQCILCWLSQSRPQPKIERVGAITVGIPLIDPRAPCGLIESKSPTDATRTIVSCRLVSSRDNVRTSSPRLPIFVGSSRHMRVSKIRR